MPIPQRYLLDALRKLRGDALVTHPDDALGVRRVERVFSVDRGADETAYLVADGEYTGTVLVQQYTVGGDKQYVEIYQAYETLPGTWVPFTRYDELLGPIQGRSRSVLNTGQASALGPTSRTTYQGRNGSSLVLIETQENWSDGGGTVDNPPFPIGTSDDYDKTRGPFQITTQVVVATGTEVGSLTVVSGVATYTRYQEIRQYAPFLLLKIVETWAVPGVSVPAETINEDGTVTLTTRTLELGTAIIEGETIGLGKWIKTSSEAYSVGIRWKIVAERPLPGNPMVATSITKDGDIQTETRTLSQLSSIATTTVIVGGVWTRTFEEPVSAIVAWKIVQVRATASALPSYSIEIPDPTPQQFRVLVPARTTSTTVIGTASLPVLQTGDLSRSQQQLDQFTYRLTVTNRDVTAGGTLTDTVLTPDGQVATEVETLQAGIQTILPDPGGLTLEAKVDNLGNNTSVKRVVTAPNLFTKSTFDTEIADLLPREFQAGLQTRDTSVIVGGVTASQPVLNPGDLKASEEQLSVQLVRRRRKSRDVSNPQPILGKQFLGGDGRLATVTKTLAVGTQILGPGPRMVRGSVDAIGDGTTVKEESVADEALLQPTTTNEQVITIPRKFLTITADQIDERIVENQAVTPTALGTGGLGVIESTTSQFEKYRGRRRTRTHAGSSVSQLTEYRSNSEGQLVTRRIDYGADGSAPTVNEFTERTEVEALGDGKFLRTNETKPFLDKVQFEVLRPNTIPERFTAADAAQGGLEATVRTEHTQVGTAQAPTLGNLAELSRSERQLDAFTKQVSVVTRSRNNFPSLRGQEYNSELDIIERYTEDLNPSGTSLGTNRVQVTPLDRGIDLIKTFDVTAAQTAMDNYSAIFQGTTNIDFPTQLLSIAAWKEESGANGGSLHDGFSNLEGEVAGTISAELTSEGGAGVGHEISYETKQLYGANAPCTHYLFFVPSNYTRTEVIAKLVLLGAAALQQWPKWVPKAHSIVLGAASITVRQTASASATSGVRTNYNGEATRSRTARQGGFSNSANGNVSFKAVRLPPTIHSLISPTNGTFTGELTSTRTCHTSARVVLGVIAYPPNGDVLNEGEARASITPTEFAATPGTATLPVSGLYLYRLFGEPTKAGRIRMHAEVVDFSLLQ